MCVVMKEDLKEMRRLVRLLMFLLLISCIGLIAASIALMRSQCMILREDNMLSNVRNPVNGETGQITNVYIEPLAQMGQKEYKQRRDRVPYKITSEDASFPDNQDHVAYPLSNDNEFSDPEDDYSSRLIESEGEPNHPISIDDILITIKTTKKYHSTRLKLIAKTWYSLAANRTLFISDAPVSADEVPAPAGDVVPLQSRVRVTDCPSSHERKALCCKMAWELDAFLEANSKWWCHFDDDNYVNVDALVRTLGRFDHRRPWYLGRPSIRGPLKVTDRGNPPKKLNFWFATGGAGFCVSRALGLKMMPVAGGGKLISIGDHIRLPDDVTVGYIVEHLLREKLTILNKFHSHLESMQFLDQDSLKEQISLSYSSFPPNINLISITGLHPKLDPTRMLSLHCMLHPDTAYCPR